MRPEGSRVTASPGRLHVTQQCEAERSRRSGYDPGPIDWYFFLEQRSEKPVELRGLEPLTFCMPCSTIPSDNVALGLVVAVQSGFGVWGRLARSGGIWGRWSWVWYWFAGPPGQGRFNHDTPDRGRRDGSGDRQLRGGHCLVRWACRRGRQRRMVQLDSSRSAVRREQALMALTTAELGSEIPGQPSAHGHAPRRAALSDRLIRSTMARRSQLLAESPVFQVPSPRGDAPWPSALPARRWFRDGPDALLIEGSGHQLPVSSDRSQEPARSAAAR